MGIMIELSQEKLKRICHDLDEVSAGLRPLHDSLAGSRIFITGGTGFFGKWLLSACLWANVNLDAGIRLTVLSRNPQDFLQQYPEFDTKEIAFCQGDIRDFVLPEEKYDYIVHGATDASARLNAENPLLMFDTVVQGTRRVLDFAVRSRARRMLLISSGAVYGRQPEWLTHVPETYPGGPDLGEPQSSYAEAKRAAELLAAIYMTQHGLPVLTARCFAFVGPYLNLDIHFAIGNFIRNGLNAEPIIVKGDGSTVRSYMYAADLVVWLLTILVNGKAGRAYNVGSNEGISIADLATMVSRTFAEKPAVNILGKRLSGTRVDRYVPDVSRARRELGLNVNSSLDESIRRTIDWHQG